MKTDPQDFDHLGTEIAKQLHETFLEAMENRYKEILSFVGFMLPALGGFLLLLQRYETGGRTSGDALLLFVGTLASLFLLTWGAMYVLAISYRYRYLQASCYKIEEHSGASQWIPYSFKPQQSTLRRRLLLCIAPGILQVHLVVFLSAITAISCIYYVLIVPADLTSTVTNEKRQEVRIETSGSTLVVTGAVVNSDTPTLSAHGVVTGPQRASVVASGVEKKPLIPTKSPPANTTKTVITSDKNAEAKPHDNYPATIIIASGFCLAFIYYFGSVHYPNKMNKIVANLASETVKRYIRLITGPSGSGKSTLVAHYCKHKNCSVPVPVTTRPERATDARRAKTLLPTEFQRLENEGRLSFVAQNYGYSYGYLSEDISSPTITLVEVDSDTAIKQLNESGAIVIRVLPARIDKVVLLPDKYGHSLVDRKADLARQTQPDFILERQRAGEYLFVNRFNEKSCEEFVNFVDRTMKGVD